MCYHTRSLRVFWGVNSAPHSFIASTVAKFSPSPSCDSMLCSPKSLCLPIPSPLVWPMSAYVCGRSPTLPSTDGAWSLAGGAGSWELSPGRWRFRNTIPTLQGSWERDHGCVLYIATHAVPKVPSCHVGRSTYFLRGCTELKLGRRRATGQLAC